MADPAWPPPSVALAGSCVLHGDATPSDTMWLTPGTTLNCQGHRLKPMTTGTLDNPRTATNEFQPSGPELALLVRNAYNVNIENCVISGFDFGIIVAQSKAVNAPEGQTGNKILGNTITSTDAASTGQVHQLPEAHSPRGAPSWTTKSIFFRRTRSFRISL